MVDMSVLKNTIEGMASDAEDRGEISFKMTMYVQDAFALCRQAEVVRCHDCASCTDETRNQETVHCKAFSAFMDRNDFCSRGVPMEENK